VLSDAAIAMAASADVTSCLPLVIRNSSAFGVVGLPAGMDDGREHMTRR
jgi:hypothetical protein